MVPTTATSATLPRIHVTALFDKERIKLPELDRRITGGIKADRKWFLTQDKEWSYYSRKLSDESDVDDGDALSRQVLSLCRHDWLSVGMIFE